MQCPRCGYVLTPFDEKCPRCSHRLPANPASGPAPAVPAQRLPDPMQLRRVSSQPITPAAAQPASASSAVPLQVARARSPRRALWATLLLLLAIPLAGGLVVVAKRSGGGSSPVEGSGTPGTSSVAVPPPVSDVQISQRLMGAGAALGGQAEVSLAWNTLSDFDLQVRAPSGELVTAENPQAQCGGVQDVDANPTLLTAEGSRRLDAGQTVGPGDITPIPEFLIDLGKNQDLPEGFRDLFTAQGRIGGRAATWFSRSPVEHIYFARAPKGTYTAYAHCFSWREPDSQPEPFTLQVRAHGRVTHQLSGTLGPQSYILHHAAPVAMCQFEVR